MITLNFKQNGIKQNPTESENGIGEWNQRAESGKTESYWYLRNGILKVSNISDLKF